MLTLATLHLADLNREPRMRIPTQLDWGKIPRILAGTWPAPVPDRIIVRAEDQEMAWAILVMLQNSLGSLVIDTEYNQHTKYLTLLGVGFLHQGAVTGFQVECAHLPRGIRRQLGSALDQAVKERQVIFQNCMADIPVLEANLGIPSTAYGTVEDLMLAHAVLWSEWPHDLEFLASLYSPYAKMKHLAGIDQLLYNWGDVCDTAAAWLAIEQELKADPASERIYREQSLPITLRSLLEAKKRGIKVNAARVLPAAEEYAGKTQDAQRLAWAWTGWPINLGSNPQVGHYLYGQANLPKQVHRQTRKATINADAIASLRTHLGPAPDFEEEDRNGLTQDQALARCQEGADPVLESRVNYAHAVQANSHYIRPAEKALADGGRFYPEFLIHAQASGRWSTNNPPLAQLPEDLRDIIQPDEGWTWLGWDWDQIELRLNAALSRDQPTLTAFEKGWDIHTLNCCDLFGFPRPSDLAEPHLGPAAVEWRQSIQWEGKADTRRVFAKRFVYRLDYGGDPARAGDIPGAKTLGLMAPKLAQAAQRYLAAHPAKASWRLTTAANATQTRQTRTFMGRLRKLMGDRNQIIREAFNHPMQGGVADIFNLTYVRILDELPWLLWVYGMFDSQWWACPVDRVTDTWPMLKAIVEREWEVYGVKVRFPATFKERA